MERYLRVNLLGPGPRLMKKNLPGRGLTRIEKHCLRGNLMIAKTAETCSFWFKINQVSLDTVVFDYYTPPILNLMCIGPCIFVIVEE